MGYGVPATIGCRLANPDKVCVGIIGDGAFLMSCMEIVTATARELGCVFFVFRDGELAQISQTQAAPYNRKTCTVLPAFSLEDIARATNSEYVMLPKDSHAIAAIDKALRLAQNGRNVIVNVNIDYSKPTQFTQGILQTQLKRLPVATRARFIGRAMLRRFTS